MFFRKTSTNGESHRALADAERQVVEIRSRTVEVIEVADALREARKKNHFAEQINLLMGKKA